MQQRQRRQPPLPNQRADQSGIYSRSNSTDDDPVPEASISPTNAPAIAPTSTPPRIVGARTGAAAVGGGTAAKNSSAFRASVSLVLHCLGAALGIYQLGRLYIVVLNRELVHAGGGIGAGGGVGAGRGGFGPGRRTAPAEKITATTITSTKQKEAKAGASAKATSEGAASTLFPPYMFYTAANITKAELDSEASLYRSHCRDLNPTYTIRMYDDAMSRSFVSKHYPEWLPLYDGLDVPVMRADMWRYLILHQYGGVYFDGDVDCKRPIDEWAKVLGVKKDDPDRATKIAAMVGIEYRRKAPQIDFTRYPDRLQFAQWTMASQPGHKIYYRTVEMINETIAHIRGGGDPPGDAVYITGPVMFSRAIIEFMVDHGRLTWDQVVKAPGNNDVLVNDTSITEETDLLVADLAILHENAFAYRGKNRGAAGRNENHPTVYARHWYRGGWKPEGWKKKSEKYTLFREMRIRAVTDKKGGEYNVKDVKVTK